MAEQRQVNKSNFYGDWSLILSKQLGWMEPNIAHKKYPSQRTSYRGDGRIHVTSIRAQFIVPVRKRYIDVRTWCKSSTLSFISVQYERLMELDGFDKRKTKLGSQTAATLCFPSWLSSLTRNWFWKRPTINIANTCPDCLAHHLWVWKAIFLVSYSISVGATVAITLIRLQKRSLRDVLAAPWILAYNARTGSLNCVGSLYQTTNLILSPV